MFNDVSKSDHCQKTDVKSKSKNYHCQTDVKSKSKSDHCQKTDVKGKSKSDHCQNNCPPDRPLPASQI